MKPISRLRLAPLLLLAWLVAAGGCSPPPKPPAPVLLRLVAVPSLVPLAERLGKEYQASARHVEPRVTEAGEREALAAVAEGQADLAFIERLPEPGELRHPDDGRRWLRTWPVAVDHIAVVAHPSNPVQALATSDLGRIFEGLERRWAAFGGVDEPIQLVSREPGAAARVAFEQGVLEGSRVAGSAVLMPGDAAVAEYVAKHPEAIGYVSMAWVTGALKVIAVDGRMPGAVGGTRSDPFSHPIAIVSRTGRGGTARAFITFALRGSGRKVVGSLYVPAP